MRRIAGLCRLLYLVFLVMSSSSFGTRHQLGAVAAAAEFDVGVILDSKTWIGNVSWTCMTMAVEDFYKEHQNHTPRLSLHLRDTEEEDTIAAADAVLMPDYLWRPFLIFYSISGKFL
ncbi:hypothetical protein Cni_G03071 [Canna indica]|uniref:Glutamate receptor n=1 Tax=Canna indica TaxID=4628 RepID=A0AAQ3JQE7_9LILI|nr:hypothetical protein Cni_G03071 [Canna indica]